MKSLAALIKEIEENHTFSNESLLLVLKEIAAEIAALKAKGE